MAHIHELIDFVVTAFIVHENKVLLVHHKELNWWLPVGGHIELDEDPEEALFREIKEESGISKEELTILSDKPNLNPVDAKILYRPNFLDIHTINEKHKHIGLNYLLLSRTDQVLLAEKEHYQIKWFTLTEVEKMQLKEAVLYYCKEALKLASTKN